MNNRTARGIRIGLNFTEVTKGAKRKVVHQRVNGIIVFGNEELPVPIHAKERLAPAGAPGHDGNDSPALEGKGGENVAAESPENASARTVASTAPAFLRRIVL